MIKTIQTIAVGLMLMPTLAVASQEGHYGVLAKSAVVAIECGMYASFAEKKDLVPKFYANGIQASRELIEAIRKGRVSDKVLRSEVPLLINWILRDGGPSDDFMIGRIFEQATTMATEAIIQEDNNGLPLPMKEWRFDPEVQKMVAENKYSRENCWALLKPATQPHQQ